MQRAGYVGRRHHRAESTVFASSMGFEQAACLFFAVKLCLEFVRKVASVNHGKSGMGFILPCEYSYEPMLQGWVGRCGQ